MIWLIENPMFRIGAWGFLKKSSVASLCRE